MSLLKCKMCGGTIITEPDGLFAVCEYCGLRGPLSDLVMESVKEQNKGSGSPTSACNSQSSGSDYVISLMKRIYLFLENESWKEADAYCEKALDVEPENAEVYLCKLLAELHLRYQGDIVNLAYPPTEKKNFKNALRFANEDLKKKLEGYVAQIERRIELKDQMDEQQEQENRERAEAVVTAIVKKVCLTKIKLPREELEEIRQTYNSVESLYRNYNGINNKIAELKVAVQEKENNIAMLRVRISRLGAFKAREKKECEEKIETCQYEKATALNELYDTQQSLLGFESKTYVEEKLNSLFNRKRMLERRLPKNTENRYANMSFQEAVSLYNSRKTVREYAGTLCPQIAQIVACAQRTPPVVLFGKFGANGNEAAPIEWNILSRENNSLLLISRYPLTALPYEQKKSNATWEQSSLRHWLNTEFLTKAFQESDRDRILQTTVKAHKNPEGIASSGREVSDKVFLLSLTEVEKYFKSTEERSYDSENGLPVIGWWTRTHGRLGGAAAYVHKDGVVDYGGTGIQTKSVGVRPVIWVSIDS